MEDILGNFEMATVISCPVCRDLYNLTDQHPVNIPCGHTFCHQCLQALSNLKVPLLMCPVCRKKHYGVRGSAISNFPKNYQLLEVIEKAIEIKKKSDSSNKVRRLIKCRDCKNEVTEDSCTQCSCVKDVPNEDLDFMGRSKNLLICIDCINKSHSEHDVKPMNVVKAEFDNFKINHEMIKSIERIKGRAESALRAIDNSKEELRTLVNTVETTMTNLRSKSKDAAMFCSASKYLNQLKDVEKNVSSIGEQAHSFATDLGSQCDFIKGFGNRTPRMPRVSLPGPHPLLPRPAAGDENVRLVVRFAEAAGAVGHARLQEVANQARAAAEIRNLAGPEQPINGDARVIIFNDMLRGIFRVIDDVANPAGNEEVHIPDDEPNGENELNAGGNQVVNDDAVAIVAAQDVRELQNVEAVDRGAEVEEEDVDARPVVEMLIDDEPPAPMDVPEIEPVPRQLRARIRPQQQVEEAVPANAEPEVRRERRAARRDRGIPIRHDPVQRDRQNNGNARGRRPARR